MSPTKRIHLERSEAMFFLVIILLSHALLFFVGVFMGWKLQQIPVAGNHQQRSHSTADRKPALMDNETETLKNNETSEQDEPGSAIKKAFRHSKQQAFVDLVLNREVSAKPESVASVEAHFHATSGGDRMPASVAEPVNSKVEASEVPTANNPAAVKKLFERAPSSIDVFKARPGTFTVQVGSYASPEEAQAKIREMRERGFNEAYIVSVKSAGGDWHRVQFGSFPNQNWAKKAGEKIVRYQLAHGFLVQKVQ